MYSFTIREKSTTFDDIVALGTTVNTYGLGLHGPTTVHRIQGGQAGDYLLRKFLEVWPESFDVCLYKSPICTASYSLSVKLAERAPAVATLFQLV